MRAPQATLKQRSCPCTSDEEKRKWGAVVAFLTKVEELGEEGPAFSSRSWGYSAYSALQAAVEGGDGGALELALQCYEGDVDAKDHDGCTVHPSHPRAPSPIPTASPPSLACLLLSLACLLSLLPACHSCSH